MEKITNSTKLKHWTTTINEIIDNVNTIIPEQTGMEGKFLTTDGENTSWGVIPTNDSINTDSSTEIASSKAVKTAYDKAVSIESSIPTKLSQLQNDSKYQTEAQVAATVSKLVDSAPETLDTLNELAAALGNDPNFATTIANQIGTKAPIAHASTETTYGVASDKNYGHAKASSTTPKAAGTASAGTETGTFARGDHVHPVQTSVSGNSGTTTKLKTARTIGISGAVTGTATSFDGSANITIPTTALDVSKATAGTLSIARGGTGRTDGYAVNVTEHINLTAKDNIGYVSQDDASSNDVADRATLAWWNGAYSDANKSNLTYCANGTIVGTTGNQTIGGTKTFSSTISGSINGNAATATKANQLTTARTIDGVSFNGTGNIIHFGTCSTAAATAAKVVSCTGFTLATGAEITVQFTVTNSAASPTLNVNNTGAKAITYRNAAISAGYLAANRVYKFVYDGTNYELIGDVNTDTNTDTKVTQTVSTANSTYPLLACATANATATATTTAIFCKDIKINPSAGSITAKAVYNAVWNDYAEFFPRGEETEAGDIIALDINSDKEIYVKATKDTSHAVGIHSDSYGHLIGGDTPPDGEDFVEYNIPRYIPVGLAGRVNCKVIGKVKKGDMIVISDIAGVGRVYNKNIDDALDIIGMACASSEDENIKKIKVKIKC